MISLIRWVVFMRGIFLKRVRKIVTIFVMLVVTFSLFGCIKGDKDTILAKDVKSKSKLENKEIFESIFNLI